MRDYDSNDEAGAAYLAREDADDDRPTRAEAERDERDDPYQHCSVCGGLHHVDDDCQAGAS